MKCSLQIMVSNQVGQNLQENKIQNEPHKITAIVHIISPGPHILQFYVGNYSPPVSKYDKY